MKKQVVMPPSTYGMWSVTTEGDEEGRTVRHLGSFLGQFDDIALHLADKAYYGLRFEYNSAEVVKLKPTKSEVQVSLGISTGTWDVVGQDRVKLFSSWLQFNGRKQVSVSEGQFYACVNLQGAKTPEEMKKMQDNLKREAALNKLTAEDKKLLGLG